jgi:hypothetical protein
MNTPALFIWVKSDQFSHILTNHRNHTCHINQVPLPANVQYAVPFLIVTSPPLTSFAFAWSLFRFFQMHVPESDPASKVITLTYSIGPRMISGILLFDNSLHNAYERTLQKSTVDAFDAATDYHLPLSTCPEDSYQLRTKHAIQTCMKNAQYVCCISSRITS